MQRKIKKIVQKNGICIKAQQAIKLDYENKKSKRKLLQKEKREIQKELIFQKRQEKKRQKKRGH